MRGSHHKFVHRAKHLIVIVPHPKRDLPRGTVRSIYKQAGWPKDWPMPHYIALIHKETDSSYGVSFPDVPGVIAAGETIDEAMRLAAEVLAFAAEDWEGRDGSKQFPPPRTIDELRANFDFQQDAADAVIAAVPFRLKAEAAE